MPAARRPRRYDLVHEGRRYSPKYAVSLAVRDATGAGTGSPAIQRRSENELAFEAPGFLCSCLSPRRRRRGFVRGRFPSRWQGGVDSRPDDLEALLKDAEKVLRRTLTRRVRKAANGKVDVLTVGIDLLNGGGGEQAQLVAACELATGQVFWTGKYPTSDEERDLVQVVDLETPPVKVAGEGILVLGCHDLKMFSPRSRASQVRGSARWRRCGAMRRPAREFRPTVVLQHPHSADSPAIWRTAWAGVARKLPGVKAWASGIAYFGWGGSPRGRLHKVLAATWGGAPTVDFVVLPQRRACAGRR